MRPGRQNYTPTVNWWFPWEPRVHWYQRESAVAPKNATAQRHRTPLARRQSAVAYFDYRPWLRPAVQVRSAPAILNLLSADPPFELQTRYQGSP
jgi:hypothetical protein